MEPINRREMFLNALATGDPVDFKPENREEALLHAIAKNRTHYTEVVETDIAGMVISSIELGGTVLSHGKDIPFALGQVWDTNYDKNLPVKEAEDGTLYIGSYPDAVGTPFYVTKEATLANAGWIRYQYSEPLTLTCVSGSVSTETVHKLDAKYLPDGVGGACLIAVTLDSASSTYTLTKFGDSTALTVTDVVSMYRSGQVAGFIDNSSKNSYILYAVNEYGVNLMSILFQATSNNNATFYWRRYDLNPDGTYVYYSQT